MIFNPNLLDLILYLKWVIEHKLYNFSSIAIHLKSLSSPQIKI